MRAHMGSSLMIPHCPQVHRLHHYPQKSLMIYVQLSDWCSLMDHGLLYMNFTDATCTCIAEGDGDRIMCCWKFLLLHFYTDRGSSKYALEALYLQLQQQAILSPRQGYRQRWNRSVNNHGVGGSNVPIDLEVEYDNNSIKEGIRKLCPNLTHAAVTRVACMLPVARVTVQCSMYQRSVI